MNITDRIINKFNKLISGHYVPKYKYDALVEALEKIMHVHPGYAHGIATETLDKLKGEKNERVN